LARSFCYYENKFEILGEPSILFFNNYAFKSAKPNELKKYMSRHYAKLKISVGKYRVIHDLFRNDSLALILKSHNTEEKIWISTSELSTIGSIDAEFIYGQFKSTDSTPDRPPIKRKQRKK
jgi:hypothetical protein